jgi:dipeptidyl aminopeptidase/acylaminoacyl peptidase
MFAYGASAGPGNRMTDSSLLDFHGFFKPATYQAPLVSPDGRWVSYIGRYRGAYNIFVGPINDIEAATPLTAESGRGIQWYTVSGAVTYRWTADGKYILYLKDNNGDENNRIYAVSVADGTTRNLTPGAKVRAHILAISRQGANRILAALDTRFRHLSMWKLMGYDIVDIDVDTGRQTLIMQDIPYVSVLADNDLRVRLVATMDVAQTVNFLRFGADESTLPFYTVTSEDLGGLAATAETDSLRFSTDNQWLYLLDAVGRDTVASVVLNMETGCKTVVASDPRVDIRDVLFDPATNRVAAYGTVWTRLKWHAVDPLIEADLDFLKAFCEGDLRVASRSADGRIWIVTYAVSDQPTTYYAYESALRRMTKLFVTSPELEGKPLVRVHPYEIVSRDGLPLVGYYMLPQAVDPDRSGRPSGPSPLVVYVHGGPTDERAQYGYTPRFQWLANRGYAVLNVNYRGSAGFGKAYLNAMRMQWGDKMHDDVVDQVRWAVAQGIADPKRVGIMGGSYGGYETLIALTKSPDVFVCGVDLVGPSDLSIPLPHFDLDWMATTMGDPRTPEGLATLRARSPAHLAEKARNPLLIGQGDMDCRVPTEQSNRMVEAMQEAGAPVIYLRYPDEGHGLLRAENSASFWFTAELFLAKFLGGKAEPPTPDKYKGASVILETGGDYLPGLGDVITASKALS